jgi:ribosome-binding factor A
MQPNKLQRINEDIQRVLASLLRGIKDPRINQGMISVTGVDTTTDLRRAKVFLSVYGLQSEKDFSKGLRSASGYLRRELGQALDLRYTPELQFELDKSIERGARINTLLRDLDTEDQRAPTAADPTDVGGGSAEPRLTEDTSNGRN